mmetsp:Transcript_42768/g.138731  ORF Transcript_42768/g.138731 Transcript_42768/m.138731 type:complete len:109 (-) Transcript_42768:1132-1458(-)
MGRSAMRALGISYRQAKWGVAIRASLEVDRASGWKRIKTSEHKDKVTYHEMDEFFHSPLASDPDNQNKSLVHVDYGIDPVTGDHKYDLHERRAQRGSLRRLFVIFRAS